MREPAVEETAAFDRQASEGQPLVDVIVASGAAPSVAEARRLIRQGEVQLWDDRGHHVDVDAGTKVKPHWRARVGRRRWVRVDAA